MIGEDGRMTDAAPERYRGMDADEALAAVVADLRAEGLISGSQPYVHDVPHSHRSGSASSRSSRSSGSATWTGWRGPRSTVRDGTIRFHPEKPGPACI